MLYLLAIVVPPVAVLLTGRPIQAALNLLLWFLLIVPGIVHALFVVNAYLADRRTDRMVKAVKGGR